MPCVSPGAEEEREADAGAETEQKPEPESEDKTCLCSSKETEEKGKKCSCRRESSASSEDSTVSPDKVKHVYVQLVGPFCLRDPLDPVVTSKAACSNN